ncbi:putative Zinc finger, MYND-type [Helianthus anomalus]
MVFVAPLCSWCSTWKGDKICSKCKRVRYCSKAHQVVTALLISFMPFTGVQLIKYSVDQ